MKTIVRSGAVAAAVASSMLLTVPMASADPLDFSATLSLGSMELISRLPYGYYPYYWGYGYGYVPEALGLGGQAVDRAADVLIAFIPW